jgi:hypothetical protein
MAMFNGTQRRAHAPHVAQDAPESERKPRAGVYVCVRLDPLDRVLNSLVHKRRTHDLPHAAKRLTRSTPKRVIRVGQRFEHEAPRGSNDLGRAEGPSSLHCRLHASEERSEDVDLNGLTARAHLRSRAFVNG